MIPCPIELVPPLLPIPCDHEPAFIEKVGR